MKMKAFKTLQSIGIYFLFIISLISFIFATQIKSTLAREPLTPLGEALYFIISLPLLPIGLVTLPFVVAYEHWEEKQAAQESQRIYQLQLREALDILHYWSKNAEEYVQGGCQLKYLEEHPEFAKQFSDSYHWSPRSILSSYKRNSHADWNYNDPVECNVARALPELIQIVSSYIKPLQNKDQSNNPPDLFKTESAKGGG